MTDRYITTTKTTKVALKNISVQDLKNFGIQQIAYIKPVIVGENINYSIYSADGEKISSMTTLDEAIIATRQNSLEPVTVH